MLVRNSVVTVALVVRVSVVRTVVVATSVTVDVDGAQIAQEQKADRCAGGYSRTSASFDFRFVRATRARGACSVGDG